MRVSSDKNDKLVIEIGIEDDKSELHLSFVGWLSCAIMIFYILRAQSIFGSLVLLVLLSPILAIAIFISIPNRFFAHRIVVDRPGGDVTKKRHWLGSRWTQNRSFREFSGILIVEDQAHWGTLGMGPRFRLFFCLGPKTLRRRVLYVDDLPSVEEVARAAKEICNYTGWPIEFLTLKRTIEATDVVWESW